MCQVGQPKDQATAIRPALMFYKPLFSLNLSSGQNRAKEFVNIRKV